MGEGRVYNAEAVSAYSKGLDAFLGGDNETATKYARIALQIDPEMVEATRMIDRLTPRGLIKSNPVASMEYRKGFDSYMAGDMAGAAKYANSALKKNPGMVEAKRLAGRMNMRMGEPQASFVNPLRKAVKGFRGKGM